MVYAKHMVCAKQQVTLPTNAFHSIKDLKRGAGKPQPEGQALPVS